MKTGIITLNSIHGPKEGKKRFINTRSILMKSQNFNNKKIPKGFR